jgi:hypothetical protein
MVRSASSAYAAALINAPSEGSAPIVIIELGTPVTRTAAPHPRWTVVVVAAVAMLAVAIGGVAGAFLVGGRSSGAGAGAAASYVPADAVMYMELRLDLPGDQREKLRQVLDRFEPIDADTLLGAKLGEWLDDKLSGSHDPEVRYTSDIAPWFSGQVAMSLNDYPTMTDPTQLKFPEAVAFLGVRDASAAVAFADRMRAEAADRGARFDSENHGGTVVWSLKAQASTGEMHAAAPGFAYAVSGDQLLLGSGSAAVTHALDVHAGGTASLAQRDDLRRLATRLPADRVGFASFDYTSVMQQVRAEADTITPGLGAMLDEMMGSAPLFGVAAARFEADRLTFEGVTSTPAGGHALQNTERQLARWAPADAIFFSDGPNVGRALTQVVTAMKNAFVASGMGQDQLDQVESALGGDVESFVSWIGDGAIVAGWDGEQPYGGLVLTPTDSAAARQRLGQLAALARLGSGQAGVPISVSDETVAGETVTTIRYEQPAAGATFAPDGFALQFAVTDANVLIGFGDRFVGRALALPESQSLAASQRFERAISSVGPATNAGSAYLDLAALRAVAEKLMPADASQRYQQFAQPYLTPFDYFVSVTRLDGSVGDSRAALVVR